MAKHTFAVYVDDKPGVLNRVASLFRRRAFNIESLTVGQTHEAGLSRMTVGWARPPSSPASTQSSWRPSS